MRALLKRLPFFTVHEQDPTWDFRSFIQALNEDGIELHRTQGSHEVFVHSDGREVAVAAPHERYVPIGTLKNMIRQAAWSEDDHRRLGLNS